MDDIENFINELNHIKNNKLILNFNGLIKSLKKLEKVIGMNSAKKTIITQIKYYLVNKSRSMNNLDSHMFHTTVLGPPGCGKTTLAEILAEIWVCLGILKINGSKSNNVSVVPINSELNKILATNVALSAQLSSNKQRFDKIKKDVLLNRLKLLSVRKKIRDANLDLNSKKINGYIGEMEEIAASINHSVRQHFETIIEPIDSTEEPEPENVVEENTEFDAKDYIIKYKRNDLVGKYVGHTAIKTREALLKGLDKVIFIDEAYELYNSTDSGDSFGMECLSTILNFMNEYSDRCIIIFAGYENLLKDTIFRVQPGLERRIQWSFTITDYSIKELVCIFEKQLNEQKWILQDKEKILNLFEKNKELFKFGGGDTLRMCLYTKGIYSNHCFKKLIEGKELNSIITFEMVKEALEILRNNQNVKKDEVPFGMYV